MSANLLDLSGFERLTSRFARIANPDPIPLMVTFGRIIEEDNRKGILAGLDKDGNPLAPVEYRPVDEKGKKSRAGLPVNASQRLNQRKRAKRGVFAGFGIWASGLHNNLTRAEYERLDGPPLAPRGQFSRVITNLAIENPERLTAGPGGFSWMISARWIDVVSVKGVHFLPFHFNGEGQRVRDLRGVRPAGREKARKSARAWMIDQIRSEQP